MIFEIGLKIGFYDMTKRKSNTFDARQLTLDIKMLFVSDFASVFAIKRLCEELTVAH